MYQSNTILNQKILIDSFLDQNIVEKNMHHESLDANLHTNFHTCMQVWVQLCMQTFMAPYQFG